ncbi:MAG: hypothetical protein M3115_00485 [Thermoproteota archaeon]|nr:hypothetical protein [Thermoproteota archaeon]
MKSKFISVKMRFFCITEFRMKKYQNYILAMDIGTVLILSAFSVAMPTLTPIPAYAPSEDGNNNNNDSNHNDNNYGNELEFLIDVLECFSDNHNSNSDLQDCIEDAIDQYENNGNNNGN